jgi:predicted nucleic acid-binding protein
LISPDILFLEVAHALTRAERRGVIKPPEALVKLADVLSTAPYFYPFGPFLTRAAALSSQTRVGVYDCLYVVLAQQEQCAVVTADLRLKTVFRAQVILLADLP